MRHLPDELRTDEFLLRPIRVDDAELDHDAVMESREFLRIWEQSTWPEDDFTAEDNRDDMTKAVSRHGAGEAFTFTVMDLAETQCLGCVYVFPTSATMFTDTEATAFVDGAQWTDHEMVVYFWVRTSRLADELDRRLLDSLVPWLVDDWGIEHPLVVTHELLDQQTALIERTDLVLTFEISDPAEAGVSRAYALPRQAE